MLQYTLMTYYEIHSSTRYCKVITVLHCIGRYSNDTLYLTKTQIQFNATHKHTYFLFFYALCVSCEMLT